MQISSQKSRGVLLRPINKKKSSRYLFSLERYVCLKIGGHSHANSVGRFLAQFAQKLFNLWRSDGIGCNPYILIFIKFGLNVSKMIKKSKFYPNLKKIKF